MQAHNKKKLAKREKEKLFYIVKKFPLPIKKKLIHALPFND
jgi:hypothetical protein